MPFIRLCLLLLLCAASSASAQTVIDLNNGGNLRSKTLRDYDREATAKAAREDSIRYADCLKRAFSALHCDSLAEAKKFFNEALTLRPTAEGNYIVEQHLGEIAEVEGLLNEAEAHYTKALRQKPVSQEELSLVKNIMAGEMMRILDGPFGIADVTTENILCGFDNSHIQQNLERIRQTTPEELQDLAQKYLRPEDLVTVVVG